MIYDVDKILQNNAERQKNLSRKITKYTIICLSNLIIKVRLFTYLPSFQNKENN